MAGLKIEPDKKGAGGLAKKWAAANWTSHHIDWNSDTPSCWN